MVQVTVGDQDQAHILGPDARLLSPAMMVGALPGGPASMRITPAAPRADSSWFREPRSGGCAWFSPVLGGMAARLVFLLPDRALPGAGARLKGLCKELLEPQVQHLLVPGLGDTVPLILKSQELVAHTGLT